MTKNLPYVLFIVASMVVVLMFTTTNSFLQLGVATVLYPTLIFLGFMVFPRHAIRTPRLVMHTAPPIPKIQTKMPNSKNPENVVVADIDKRTFIKFLGATGISFLLFSILGRGIEGLVFGGKNSLTDFNSNPGGTQNPVSGNPTDNYRITEIDENETSYFGFTDNKGQWLIMLQDADGSAFRYAKGHSDFPTNWENRKNLNYDYYYKLEDY